MDENLKKEVINDLEGARAMVGQAQNRIGSSLIEAKQKNLAAEWTDLGMLFNLIDDKIEEVRQYA